MNFWSEILETRADVSRYLLAHADLDPRAVWSSHDAWFSYSPAALQRERSAGWLTNDGERFMLARSLLAIFAREQAAELELRAAAPLQQGRFAAMRQQESHEGLALFAATLQPRLI